MEGGHDDLESRSNAVSSLQQLFAILATLPTYVVTVSGEFISHSVANGNTARAGIRLNTADGTIDKLEGTTFTQIDASTDVLIPNQDASGFHIKFTKGALDPTPAFGTLDTWLAWTSDLEVYYEETVDDSQDSGTITVHVSDDGGTTTLDTGDFILTATRGTPI